MTLLGREPLLAVLDEELTQAVTGTGRLVLVTGEAGIGKSSLVDAFRARAADRVRTVLGRCDPLSVPRTLGPITDIAKDCGGTPPGGTSGGAVDPADILEAISAEPTLVVIEDAHWADQATLDFLVFAWRRLRGSPCLWVVTFRPDDVADGNPLRLALGRAASARPRRLDVPPLTSQAIATLATGSGLDPVELARVTAGNPFYVTEALASGLEGVPPTVVDSVLARAAPLPLAARRALDAASTFPAGTTYDVLGQVIGETAGIDVCLDARLLVVDIGRLKFRHELARRAIRQELPAHDRKTWHAAALTVLEARWDEANPGESDAAELAFHAVEAGRSDAITRYCLRAGDQAIAGAANRDAARHYLNALTSGDPLDDVERARTLEKLGLATASHGTEEEAVGAYRDAAEIWHRLGDVAAEGSATVSQATHLWSSGHGPEARAVMDHAIDLLRPVGGERLAAAHAQQASLLMLARDLAGALEAGARAVEMAEPLGADVVLARAYNAIGTSLWFVRPEEAEPTLTRSLEHASAAQDARLVASAMVNLGSGAGEIRSYDVAERWLDSAIEWCDKHDLDSNGDYARAWQARVALERGRWSRAAELAHGVLATPCVAIARIVSLTVLGLVRVRRGDTASDDLLADAWSLALGTGDLQRLWPAAVARAEESWWAQGRVTNVSDLEAILDLAVGRDHPWAVGELAWWLWRDSGRRTAPPSAHPIFAAAISGDLRMAAEMWSSLGCPFDAAVALLDTDEEDAIQTALATFDSLGAVPAAKRARARLRLLGAHSIPRGSRPATSADPDGLTPRESEVMALVHQGLSNARIAAELVVSPRTVDRHVSNALQKLGTSTRQEAAAAWARSHAAPNLGAGRAQPG